ncbi:hypothetical protein HDU96_009070 [Phlyctochytrium bullatum]|nr:hypothetical protein HDU96_009070 [Phlyctochytrium bullatum]
MAPVTLEPHAPYAAAGAVIQLPLPLEVFHALLALLTPLETVIYLDALLGGTIGAAHDLALDAMTAAAENGTSSGQQQSEPILDIIPFFFVRRQIALVAAPEHPSSSPLPVWESREQLVRRRQHIFPRLQQACSLAAASKSPYVRGLQHLYRAAVLTELSGFDLEVLAEWGLPLFDPLHYSWGKSIENVAAAAWGLHDQPPPTVSVDDSPYRFGPLLDDLDRAVPKAADAFRWWLHPPEPAQYCGYNTAIMRPENFQAWLLGSVAFFNRHTLLRIDRAWGIAVAEMCICAGTRPASAVKRKVNVGRAGWTLPLPDPICATCGKPPLHFPTDVLPAYILERASSPTTPPATPTVPLPLTARAAAAAAAPRRAAVSPPSLLHAFAFSCATGRVDAALALLDVYRRCFECVGVGQWMEGERFNWTLWRSHACLEGIGSAADMDEDESEADDEDAVEIYEDDSVWSRDAAAFLPATTAGQHPTHTHHRRLLRAHRAAHPSFLDLLRTSAVPAVPPATPRGRPETPLPVNEVVALYDPRFSNLSRMRFRATARTLAELGVLIAVVVAPAVVGGNDEARTLREVVKGMPRLAPDPRVVALDKPLPIPGQPPAPPPPPSTRRFPHPHRHVLLPRDLDFDASGFANALALWLAAALGRDDCARFLVGHGVRREVAMGRLRPASAGEGPLCVAEALRAVVEDSGFGAGPLAVAVVNGLESTVKWLLELRGMPTVAVGGAAAVGEGGSVVEGDGWRGWRGYELMVGTGEVWGRRRFLLEAGSLSPDSVPLPHVSPHLESAGTFPCFDLGLLFPQLLELCFRHVRPGIARLVVNRLTASSRTVSLPVSDRVHALRAFAAAIEPCCGRRGRASQDVVEMVAWLVAHDVGEVWEAGGGDVGGRLRSVVELCGRVLERGGSETWRGIVEKAWEVVCEGGGPERVSMRPQRLVFPLGVVDLLVHALRTGLEEAVRLLLFYRAYRALKSAVGGQVAGWRREGREVDGKVLALQFGKQSPTKEASVLEVLANREEADEIQPSPPAATRAVVPSARVLEMAAKEGYADVVAAVLCAAVVVEVRVSGTAASQQETRVYRIMARMEGADVLAGEAAALKAAVLNGRKEVVEVMMEAVEARVGDGMLTASSEGDSGWRKRVLREAHAIAVHREEEEGNGRANGIADIIETKAGLKKLGKGPDG